MFFIFVFPINYLNHPPKKTTVCSLLVCSAQINQFGITVAFRISDSDGSAALFIFIRASDKSCLARRLCDLLARPPAKEPE